MGIPAIYTLSILVATGACIVGVFYICAASIRDQTCLHDIKVEARKMRMEFDRRVSARNAGGHADTAEGADEDEEPFLIV
jgi:hypothetical protein